MIYLLFIRDAALAGFGFGLGVIASIGIAYLLIVLFSVFFGWLADKTERRQSEEEIRT